MPALSYHFGLSPTDIWSLSMDEWDAYTNALKRISKSG